MVCLPLAVRPPLCTPLSHTELKTSLIGKKKPAAAKKGVCGGDEYGTGWRLQLWPFQSLCHSESDQGKGCEGPLLGSWWCTGHLHISTCCALCPMGYLSSGGDGLPDLHQRFFSQLGAKKGLGAQKVSSQSFNEIERQAQVAEKLREQQVADAKKQAEESV